MTTFGTIDNLLEDNYLGKDLLDALRYLKTKQMEAIFQNLEFGESYIEKIDQERIFAVYQSYESKDPSEARFEGHKAYIDVQYIFEGEELIKVTSKDAITREFEYDARKDLQFFEVKISSDIKMREKMACILFPSDLHAPGIAINNPKIVKKVVVKIRKLK